MGAFRDEHLVGCGAYVNHGGEYGELKRMFVRAEDRGLGIGRRILESLEAHAAAAGLGVLRLETGVSQPEAVRLYEEAGYTRRGPFGAYADDPLSLFLEKRLDASDRNVTLRTDLRPGDLGTMVYLHGTVYAREHGYDHTFEAYVAGPLAEFARSASARERLWIAERNRRIVGCIAVVAASPQVAQLRWFLVDPSARGMGIGKKLLHEAVAFCADCQYGSIILWTVSALTAAAHLYRLIGFKKVEERPGRLGGVDVIEERYELLLADKEKVARDDKQHRSR